METKKYIDVSDGECIFFIYPKLPHCDNQEDKLRAISDKLAAIRTQATTLSKNYLWHNDQWDIEVKNALDCDKPICFAGVLNFGENIEDEWFLVYLLKELTKSFSDIVISVGDSDGEFLLIEAADHLPAWVSPETSEGRVFLYKGHLHILPQSYLPTDEDNDQPIQITEQILEYIRTTPHASQVDTTIEAAIDERIGNYPEKMDTLQHNAVLNIPVAVAALLTKEPNLVTLAVKAFCERDLVDANACRAMKFFPPEQCVLSRVKFTKCSYAMLASSKFQPDKRTGWNIPQPTDEAYKASILGIKLACGFEILLSQTKSRKSNTDTADVSEDRGWLKMMDRLQELNYFRGLLQHSKQYNQLLNAAQEFYRNNCDVNSTRQGPGVRIAQLMDSLEVDIDELKRREVDMDVTDNDDSWMDISKEELDQMLIKRFGRTSNAENTQDVAQHLKYFMNRVSDVDGVEFPKTTGSFSEPTRPPRGAKNKKRKSVQFSSDTKTQSKGEPSTSPSPRVTIEPDGFMQAVKNILDFSIPDDNSYWNSDGSDMSSYGDEDELELDDSDPRDNKMQKYFKEMDQELAGTTMGKSFVKKQAETKKREGFDDDFQPIDIDMNAFKNILLSYKTQMGEPGPSENILGPLGVNLQDIDADVD